MTELLTAAQMRAIEQAAIESGEVTGLELMERAGRGVVEAVFEEWPELAETSHRAVVLCGPGNNGGDGFVVARLLKEWGWDVEVFLYGDPARLPSDARVNYERWAALGEVLPLSAAPSAMTETDLLVDALFGTGLGRGLSDEFQDVWDSHLDCIADGVAIVAVDIASGVCADSGKEIGIYAFVAELEVSFHRLKQGHVLGDRMGRAIVKDIGINTWQHHGSQTCEPVTLVCIEESSLFKTPFDHKYDHGHALILSGGAGKTGAARLAARASLRIGAGLVTLGVPGAAQMEVAGQITALMLRRVEDGDGLASVLEDERLNAVCLGPGLGAERARELVPMAVRAEHTPYIVLDADALTAFAEEPEALFGMLHEGCVLTPHGGEFARLFPDIAEKLKAVPTKGPAYSKVDATREAAARAGCVVLFKGPDTVIADPDGRCIINSAQYERAAPWLATAGSGDVLAGFITGLLARGVAPMQAAETAAWLHVECARSFGPGLIAEDLPEELPKVFRDLGL
ncbi:NAD(P)H-hydrate dehydratase [Roseovarius faecimaris]|uniref:Bifunctional NAD(P)H-hydrate repair enzyme n=1 Tax=Roseovarius faecimaris TaxID=2494550 RepID=A0A6I6IT63_9RHOB|nr:NAD(P)H-hydrate dehydratase [Roseovarius faecimaris]QGX98506.1 NAD(P)H-hydrate dehydratase [Roseovarius faecimaris]